MRYTTVLPFLSDDRIPPASIALRYLAAVALLHYLCDVKGKAHWFTIIKPAGTLTLTCYMVPYLTGNLMRLLELHWPSFTYSGGAGLVRCALYSLAAIWIAWLLSKIHIRLKI